MMRETGRGFSSGIAQSRMVKPILFEGRGFVSNPDHPQKHLVHLYDCSQCRAGGHIAGWDMRFAGVGELGFCSPFISRPAG